MPLDGAMLSQVRLELIQNAVGCRVDKIHQPAREEMVFTLRGRQKACRMLVSVNAASPRIQLTKSTAENPKSPPMFCMLMRKLLGSALLLEVRQAGLDRILELDFESTDELGDKLILTLCVEIMGRHSNMILRRADGRIVDALKRIDVSMSSVRPVLPGMQYVLPPAPEEKRNLLVCTADEILEVLRQHRTEIPLYKRLNECLQGMSPLLCREIAYFTEKGRELSSSELSKEQWERLHFYLDGLRQTMQSGTGVPTMLLDASGKPKDFSFLPITQYGEQVTQRQYTSYGELLDAFYSEKDAVERMRQRSGDLQRVTNAALERIQRRLEVQRRELAESENREKYKVYGDLLATNLYLLKKGDKLAKVQNYYDADYPTVEIPLDERLTPNQNVQRYYHEYRKLDTAEKKLRQQISAGEMELAYMESVQDMVSRARTDKELTALRQELSQEGYLKQYQQKGKKEEKLPPLRYRSDDGFLFLVGRNNVQNDRLTLKESRGNDIWFHTQKIPGSHTIVVTEGKEVPNRTLEQACILAAYHSKAAESSKVPVDYTAVKYIKKPNGAKPGMVVYEVYQTAIVDPDFDLVERLKVKE